MHKKQDRDILKGAGIGTMILHDRGDIGADHVREHHKVLPLESREFQKAHPSFCIAPRNYSDRLRSMWSPGSS